MEAVRGDGRWCVVTGGRGFAARHLVTMLLRSGEWRVRVADLGPAITLDRDEEEGFLGAALREGQAVYVSADLRDKAQVARGAWSRRRGGALSFRVCVWGGGGGGWWI
jgi:plant 3beta-hydroxysteroid-4alpha-carboxylate 3-dehydrogenase